MKTGSKEQQQESTTPRLDDAPLLLDAN